MIKGSLLMSLPIIKCFWSNVLSCQKGSKNSCFWEFEGKIFDLEVETPRKSILTGRRKNGGNAPKNVFSRAAQEITKKIKTGEL